MKGAILEKWERAGRMERVFANFKDIIEDYNWFITDSFCSTSPDDRLDVNHHDFIESDFPIVEEELYVWILGKDFLKIIETKERLDYSWGVFSAIPKNIDKEEVVKLPFPYWETPDFWHNPITMQHHLAEIEIVVWDAGILIFISKKDELVEKFMKIYPLAEDLEKYNDEAE